MTAYISKTETPNTTDRP